jgi:hypothetical protein
MKRRCPLDDAVILDYIDGGLDESERQYVDAHLKVCRNCRARVEKQRQWLNLLSESGLTDRSEHMPDEATLARLKRRVNEELEQEMVPDHNKEPAGIFTWKPYFAARIAGIVAAGFILIWAIPMTIHLWQGSSSLRTAEATLAETTAGALALDNSKPEGDAAFQQKSDYLCLWSIYTGSLSDLPAMDCFFISERDPDDETDRTATNEHETEPGCTSPVTDSEQTNQEMTASQYFESSSKKLNNAGQLLLDTLKKADAVRVLERKPAGCQAIILASYSVDQAGQYARSLEKELRTCQIPARIEIIKPSELALILEQQEEGLSDRLFPEVPERDGTWMIIWIGT